MSESKADVVIEEAEHEQRHSGVLYGLGHPGPAEGCIYCEDTLRQHAFDFEVMGSQTPLLVIYRKGLADAAEAMLAELGFCVKCREAMPCTTCGAGL